MAAVDHIFAEAVEGVEVNWGGQDDDLALVDFFVELDHVVLDDAVALTPTVVAAGAVADVQVYKIDFFDLVLFLVYACQEAFQ